MDDFPYYGKNLICFLPQIVGVAAILASTMPVSTLIL